MNYNKLYSRFIESKRSRPVIKELGYEVHHIQPKSLGGKNTKSNLVKLTYREHYIAHRILVKMYKGKNRYKMRFALLAMNRSRFRHKKIKELTARQYEFCRSQWSDYLKTKEGHLIRSNIAKKQWTPERRAQQAEITRQQWRDGKKSYLKSAEYKKRKSEQSKLMWKDPKYRKLQTKIQTKIWADRLS